MSRTVDRYVKRVRKKLFASAKTKARLIDGLLASISELDEEPGYNDLVRAFGTPAQAAAELQSCVDEGEACAARSKAKHTAIILGAVAAILIVAFAVYAWTVSNDAVHYYADANGLVINTNYPLIGD